MLLVKRRKWDFDIKEVFRLDAVLSACTLRFLIALRPEVFGLCNPMHPSWIEAPLNRRKHRELVRPVAACEAVVHDGYTTIPRPNFIYDDVAPFGAK